MVIIYSTQRTARLEFALKLVFKSVLNIDFLLTTNRDEFLGSSFPKINYSEEVLDVPFQLNPTTLLFENDIRPFTPEMVELNGIKGFFPTPGSGLPFDVFAASFYTATRYEEYLFDGKTPHNRFPASESILHKTGLLKQPVVHHWADLLVKKIQECYPDFQVPARKFRFEMTIDIDQAWGFKNKSFPVCCGAALKSLFYGRFGDVRQRINVLSGKTVDPFDTFPLIEKPFINHPDQLKFFFLLGKRGRYDKNISPTNKNFQELIKRLSEKYTIGIHPSYASFGIQKKIISEKETLEHLLGKPVTGSRQHFLRMKFPETYENLIESGITDDFTLGYADAVGFRAGMCAPFRFFNLQTNEPTKLMIHPLLVMDVSLKDYLGMTPEQALVATLDLMEQTKKAGGTFIGLWHNESLSENETWKGWRDVYLKIAETGLKFEHEQG